MTAAHAVLTSAPVTNGPARLALTLLLVATLAAVLALMRRGWVRRGRRQADILPLPQVPPRPTAAENGGDGLLVDLPARYLGATRSGDWLDRVVVHGLGVPSAAQVSVSPAGVWLIRDGAQDIFVAAEQVVAVRHDRGAAGRAVEKDGVLVLVWQHGEQLIDLGFRVRDAVAAESLRVAVAALARPRSPALDPDPNAQHLSTTTSGELA